MRLFDYFLEQPFLFNLSQLPFTRQKFARILKHNDLSQVRRVLDVGCGPGTNAPSFAHAYYQGIDINPRYIELARRRFHRDFQVADMTKYEISATDAYDFILINSFLHHIDTDSVHRILARTPHLLALDGHVHSIEVVMPPHRGLSQLLARWDRGNFARPIDEWKAIFGRYLKTVVFEPFPVRHLGQTLMEMVYFKGRVS
jgi:Methyltransferase domain.